MSGQLGYLGLVLFVGVENDVTESVLAGGVNDRAQ
jgi:hypothetical protein